jgi:hypothetical protein
LIGGPASGHFLNAVQPVDCGTLTLPAVRSSALRLSPFPAVICGLCLSSGPSFGMGFARLNCALFVVWPDARRAMRADETTNRASKPWRGETHPSTRAEATICSFDAGGAVLPTNAFCPARFAYLAQPRSPQVPSSTPGCRLEQSLSSAIRTESPRVCGAVAEACTLPAIDVKCA